MTKIKNEYFLKNNPQGFTILDSVMTLFSCKSKE